jgi:ribosome biogenesis protein Nip4
MDMFKDFAAQFNTNLRLNQSFIIKKDNRYFLLNPRLKKLVSKDFFHAGVYLGKIKGGKFFPSFSLLEMIAEKEDANKIVVNEMTEWFFICGRDVFRQGIVSVAGSKREGDHTLVLNQHGECLGFGKILQNFDEEKGHVVVWNVADVGDFLRRER